MSGVLDNRQATSCSPPFTPSAIRIPQRSTVFQTDPLPYSLSAPVTPLFTAIDTTSTHLRDVLGDQTYEGLARNGSAMTTAAMATYAYDQIDQARAKLDAVSQ